MRLTKCFCSFTGLSISWNVQDENLLKWITNKCIFCALLKHVVAQAKLFMQHQIQVNHEEKYCRMNVQCLYFVCIAMSLQICMCIC